MAVGNVQQFIKTLAEHEEVLDIGTAVSCQLEAPGIAARSIELGGPACHFTNVKEGAREVSLASGLLGGPTLMYPRERRPWTRLALGLNLRPGIYYEDLMEALLGRFRDTIPAVRVSGGPCQEAVLEGRDARLGSLPVPHIHERDGGRYGTGHTVIVADPDSKWSPWGVYRWMVKGEDQLALNVPPRSSLHAVMAKHEAKGQPTPCCIVIGGPPAVPAAAAYPHVPGTDVAAVAGGLMQAPVELTKAKTCDLLVPCQAEIVLEGELLPGQRAAEGPFPNFAGFEPVTQQPVFRLKTITRRRNPVFTFAVEGIRCNDSLVLTSVMHGLQLTQLARLLGLPIRWIMCPLEGRMGLCVIATAVPYRGFLWQVAQFFFTNSPWFDRILFLDMDVSPEDSVWFYGDLINKADPRKSLHQSDPDARVHLVCKYPTPEGTTGRLQFDAVWDPSWPKEYTARRVSFEGTYPEEVQAKVISRWKTDYGFKVEPAVRKRVAVPWES